MSVRVAAVAAVLAWAAAPAAQQFGSITFPTSGAPAAQEAFLTGVKALHNFQFDEAAVAFQAAQKADPDFALAYWGEAMTYNHPVWMQQDAAAARAALAYADLALEKSAPDLALTGYLFAKRAQQHGADARAAMGRLDPAVGFVRPDTAAAAGHTWVERDGQDPRLAASLVERVRRAYLDAPDDAIVLDGDERIVLRIAPIVKAQLVIEHGCALLDLSLIHISEPTRPY